MLYLEAHDTKRWHSSSLVSTRVPLECNYNAIYYVKALLTSLGILGLEGGRAYAARRHRGWSTVTVLTFWRVLPRAYHMGGSFRLLAFSRCKQSKARTTTGANYLKI
jgi:hypothetical protein